MTSNPQEVYINLRELFGFLLRGALVALLLGGVVAPAMYVWTARQPPVFRAEATLLVARSQAGFTQLGLSPVTAPPIDLGAYNVAAGSDTVLMDALRFMGVDDPAVADARALRNVVGTSTEAGVRDSSLLRVDARGPTARLAAARADAVANALVAWDQRRASESIRRAIATLDQQIVALTEQVRGLQEVGGEDAETQIEGLIRLRADRQQQLGYARALVASAEGMLSVLQVADANVRQVAPRPVLSAAVAAVLAIALAYGVLLLRAVLNTRLRGSAEIATASGLHVLAEFPTVGRRDEERLREPASYLRTNLLFATEEEGQRVFLITSPGEAEGKSTVARLLAESFVRYGYQTLLVDADLRAPSLAQSYDVDEVPATNATVTEAWLREPTAKHGMVRIALGPEERLDLIPQFRAVPTAAEVLGRGFRPALGHWHDYDVIVIDSPPVLAVSDALTIAPHCSGTILVVDRKRADRRKVTVALEALRRLGVQVLGVVANNVGEQEIGAGYGSAYAPPPPLEGRSSTIRSTPGRSGGRSRAPRP